MEKKKLQKLRVRLLHPSVRKLESAIVRPRSLKRYDLRSGLGFYGRLYIAPPKQGKPSWLKFVETGTEESLRNITNRTNAAVLILKSSNRLFAFTFSHGRFLLQPSKVIADFGIRTALNSLQHDSLRSLDSFTVEEQLVHRKTQATRASGIEAFDIDVSRDILRAITGTPLPKMPFESVTGTEEVVAISARASFEDLAGLSSDLLAIYRKQTYKDHFAWVDNVRRVRDPATVAFLEDKLVKDLRSAAGATSYLSPPEPIEWEAIDGFGYTRRREPPEHDLDLPTYLDTLRDLGALDVPQLKSDKIFVFMNGEVPPRKTWTIYKSLVFDTARSENSFILAGGVWFEINRHFAEKIRAAARKIPISSAVLPRIRTRPSGSLETEPEYNQRAAASRGGLALLDGKTARCEGTSSGIEVCDIMTRGRVLIHVKHRKGGSSTLSHLFAQGRISGEALLSDGGFRKDARRILRAIGTSWESLVPTTRPTPASYEIAYFILGARKQQPSDELPFFSQLNLVRTYESLVSRGLRVTIRGIRRET